MQTQENESADVGGCSCCRRAAGGGCCRGGCCYAPHKDDGCCRAHHVDDGCCHYVGGAECGNRAAEATDAAALGDPEPGGDPEATALDAYDSIAQAAAHMRAALEQMEAERRDPCCEQLLPPCNVPERPRVFPPVLSPALPCPGVAFPAGCCAFPSRAFSSLIPCMVPCPTCALLGRVPRRSLRSCRDAYSCLGLRLLRAAGAGRTRLVRALLKEGADVNYQGAGRWTPLHKASDAVYADTVWTLLKGGADANARNCNGFTCLHLAAAGDRWGLCTSLLVCAGADLNARNEPGYTPLHVAAECSNVTAVRALVAAGAKRFLRNNEGRTPFDLAEDKAVRRLIMCRALHPISLF